MTFGSKMALIILGSIIVRVIAKCFYNIIRNSVLIVTVGYIFNIIVGICVDKHIYVGLTERYISQTVWQFSLLLLVTVFP